MCTLPQGRATTPEARHLAAEMADTALLTALQDWDAA